MKMTPFSVASMICWALAVLFLMWPFLAPPELLGFFYLAFLFAAIAIPMQWFDAREIALRVLKEVHGSRGS
jgi:hypothetical protein